jgi:hypothetical protein
MSPIVGFSFLIRSSIVSHTFSALALINDGSLTQNIQRLPNNPGALGATTSAYAHYAIMKT